MKLKLRRVETRTLLPAFNLHTLSFYNCENLLSFEDTLKVEHYGRRTFLLIELKKNSLTEMFT